MVSDSWGTAFTVREDVKKRGMKMADKKQILADLKKSVETWNLKLAKEATTQAIEAKIEPKEIIENMGEGMAEIGRLFDEAKIYLPQVVAASKAMQVGLDLLRPIMGADASAMKGTVVMGTVEGDIHEIGKNVCCAMLRGAGYNVIDLGPDVSAVKFLDTAAENNANVVGASALMTTTLLVQREIVELIKERGVSTKAIFGGAPCTKQWCDQIGGGYSSSAPECVELVNKIY